MVGQKCHVKEKKIVQVKIQWSWCFVSKPRLNFKHRLETKAVCYEIGLPQEVISNKGIRVIGHCSCEDDWRQEHFSGLGEQWQDDERLTYIIVFKIIFLQRYLSVCIYDGNLKSSHVPFHLF